MKKTTYADEDAAREAGLQRFGVLVIVIALPVSGILWATAFGILKGLVG